MTCSTSKHNLKSVLRVTNSSDWNLPDYKIDSHKFATLVIRQSDYLYFIILLAPFDFRSIQIEDLLLEDRKL